MLADGRVGDGRYGHRPLRVHRRRPRKSAMSERRMVVSIGRTGPTSAEQRRAIACPYPAVCPPPVVTVETPSLSPLPGCNQRRASSALALALVLIVTAYAASDRRRTKIRKSEVAPWRCGELPLVNSRDEGAQWGDRRVPPTRIPRPHSLVVRYDILQFPSRPGPRDHTAPP